MVRNLWSPLSLMHYGAVVNLSKDVIYHFMNKTFRQGKNRTLVESCPLQFEGVVLPKFRFCRFEFARHARRISQYVKDSSKY